MRQVSYESNQRLRPIGFRPSEISVLVNRNVIEQHASEAALLWIQRERAVCAPHYQLKHLKKLDERVYAHLIGLRIAGRVGWEIAQAALDHGDSSSVFVAAYLAFASQHRDSMRQMLYLGISLEPFCGALISALAWLDFGEVRPALEVLAKSSASEYRVVALAAFLMHRVDPGQSLASFIEHEDAILRAYALRAIGELKRRDLRDAARNALDDPIPECRFWAGYSLSLLGNPRGATTIFQEGKDWPLYRRLAIDVAMRCGDATWVRSCIRELAQHPNTLHMAIQSAGAYGDPSTVPWLLQYLDKPALARISAEAFSMITGADLDYLGLKQDAPEEEINDEENEDADLPWPKPDAVAHWWKSVETHFIPGQRYLAGMIISPTNAMTVLHQGYQRQRHAAAIELAHMMDINLLFPITDRADRQQRRLAG